MKALLSRAVVVLAAALAVPTSSTGAQDAAGLMTIATAERGGVYHPTGEAICRFINAERDRHNLRCLAPPSAGSVDNIEALRSGERGYAIVQSDVAHAARAGRGSFSGSEPLAELRTVFSLHPEPFTVIARADAGIRGMEDTKGRRINLGREGSGMRATGEAVLEAFGWAPGDMARAGNLGPDQQVAALCGGRIDVATFMVGHPSGWIQDATTACDAVLVPVEGPAVNGLLRAAPYYAPAVVKGGTYESHPDDVPTFGVRAVLVTVSDRPGEEVYELVRAVFENLKTFKRLHPALAHLEAEEMAELGVAAPLHPGAERYFREAGLLR